MNSELITAIKMLEEEKGIEAEMLFESVELAMVSAYRKARDFGDSAVVAEDLSNIVDVGEAIFNASAFDAYVRTLVNHIGKVIFVNRPYRGSAPSVLMDAWEYGSVVEKITSEMPTAVGSITYRCISAPS